MSMVAAPCLQAQGQAPRDPCPSIVVAPDIASPTRDSLEAYLAERGLPIVQRGNAFRARAADRLAQGQPVAGAACWVMYTESPGDDGRIELRVIATVDGAVLSLAAAEDVSADRRWPTLRLLTTRLAERLRLQNQPVVTWGMQPGSTLPCPTTAIQPDLIPEHYDVIAATLREHGFRTADRRPAAFEALREGRRLDGARCSITMEIVSDAAGEVLELQLIHVASTKVIRRLLARRIDGSVWTDRLPDLVRRLLGS